VPWCPKCCYEYRAGIRECPTCRVALNEEAPASPPQIAGIRLEPQTDAALRPLRGGFLQGIRIAWQAISLVCRARPLLGIVLILAWLYFVGNTWQTYWLQMSGRQLFIGGSDYLNDAVRENLAKDFRFSPEKALIRNFSAPLARPANFFFPILSTWLQLSGSESDEWSVSSLVLFILLAPISVMLLAVILEQLGAEARQSQARSLQELMSFHFLPLLPFVLIMNLELFDVLSRKWVFAGNVMIESWAGKEVVLGVNLLLVAAPFAIVNRRLGLWGGIKAALGIFVRKFWSLAALFSCYGIGFVVIGGMVRGIGFLMANPMWGFDAWDRGTVLLLAIVLYFAQALLGLWLAACFTLLVTPGEGGRETGSPGTEMG
jgi:hypothetical protein